MTQILAFLSLLLCTVSNLPWNSFVFSRIESCELEVSSPGSFDLGLILSSLCLTDEVSGESLSLLDQGDSYEVLVLEPYKLESFTRLIFYYLSRKLPDASLYNLSPAEKDRMTPEEFNLLTYLLVDSEEELELLSCFFCILCDLEAKS